MIKRDMLKFEFATKKVSEESYLPGVIEPSFGIGRIIYCLLEHCFRSRGIENQEERCFLAIPAAIAPVKCSILPLSSQKSFDPLVSAIKTAMTQSGISCKTDSSSATIGKRYARTDEIGIPYGITVDFQSLEDHTVTMRERDTMEQVRLPVEDIPDVVCKLVRQNLSWKDITIKYPKFMGC